MTGITLLSVGKVRGALAAPIADYEARVSRYFDLRTVEIREEPAGSGRTPEQVMAGEGKRVLARLPGGYEVVALHRKGRAWSSEQLAAYLGELGLRATPGAAFVIGGALGLSTEILSRANHLLSLSAMTLPHDLARLVWTEQVYRAGTILRGEPYHKGSGA